MNDKPRIVLPLVLILFLFLSLFWLYEAKVFIGKANVSSSAYSINNSYVFISPLKALGNGMEKIRLTIYILNDQGMGVQGKRIEFNSASKLDIEQIQATTDQYGKAFFDISSKVKGEYYLDVFVEGVLLPQKAHLFFN